MDKLCRKQFSGRTFKCCLHFRIEDVYSYNARVVAFDVLMEYLRYMLSCIRATALVYVPRTVCIHIHGLMKNLIVCLMPLECIALLQMLCCNNPMQFVFFDDAK